MRAAIAAAEVGDDVFGDDPTVRDLESHTARLLGKEAAVFVSSGTQSNLCALMAHCQRGDEYLVGDRAHTYMFEGGGAAVLGSIQPQTVPTLTSGMLDLGAAEAAIKPAASVNTSAADETDWITAAVAVYLEEEDSPRSALSWLPAGNEKLDPWVSTPRVQKTFSGV